MLKFTATLRSAHHVGAVAVGHIRLGTLPRTRSWDEVVALIGHGAAVPQVAQATIRAAEEGLRGAGKDRGVVDTVWLLLQLPHAARAARFPDALSELGMTVSGAPGLMALVGAFSEAVDARLANNCGRTDLGEMAQMAGAETLAGVLHERTRGFFDATAEDVRRELAGLGAVTQFGLFARTFFARLTFKCLDYFLSRALSAHVGEGRRFLTLARQAAFSEALETHCKEAAVIVQRFSGEWASKARYEAGSVSRDKTRDFVHGAMAKLLDELKRGAGLHGE
jgi:hypothetical protein